MPGGSATALRWCAAASITAAAVIATVAATRSNASSPAGAESLIPAPINHDPAQIVGPDSCAECHGNEHAVWMNSAHYSGALDLTRNELAKQIATTLGIRRIKTDDRCASCHYTIQQTDNDRLKSIAGASCESCHSAASTWIEPHANFGESATTANDETPAHRADRLQYCDSMGMVRPSRLYELASACYTCHSIDDPELAAAGHPAGTAFEFASWTQGDIRHNFVREGSHNNPPSADGRVRVMYLVGAALRLEYAVRAAAQGAPIESITSAVNNLSAICATTNLEVISELITLANAIDSQESAAAAVPRIQAIGASIAAHAIGADSHAIDELIPAPRTNTED